MRTALLALAVLLCTGCLPSYSYETTPLEPPAQSSAEQCYRDGRIALGRGSAHWSYQYRSGDYLVTESWGAAGLAVRVGGRRVAAGRAVAMVGDPELATAYRAELARTRGDRRWYPRWRNLSLGMALGGLALAVGGLVLALDDPEDDRIQPLAFTGAGVAVLSILPTLGAWRTYQGAVRHDRYQTLFSDTGLALRLAEAARAHNQRVAARCGAGASADLPVSLGAASLLRP